MTRIINLSEKLPKNTTVAIINREDNTLKAFLSTDTTKYRYCFTQKIDMMCLIRGHWNIRTENSGRKT
jgi:hypothetical protein